MERNSNLDNRRHFLAKAGVGMSALVAGAPQVLAGEAGERKSPLSVTQDWPDGVGLPKGWRQMQKFDAHSHVMQGVHKPDADWSTTEDLVEAAEILGIDTLYCSRPLTGGVMAEIEEVREANNSVLAAMKRYPERIAGYCFLQPGNGNAALEELERCLDRGMMGVKLYNQYKYSDPVVFPIAEKCIEHGIPLLGHSAYLTDARSQAAQPNTSNSLDFCELSTRFPELLLILGHINGGGDWEWAIKGLRDCPNVFIDTSGSVQESDAIDRCVEQLGHERILFATDLTMEGGVGKVLSAEITAGQREDIFWRNFQGILDQRKS